MHLIHIKAAFHCSDFEEQWITCVCVVQIIRKDFSFYILGTILFELLVFLVSNIKLTH